MNLRVDPGSSLFCYLSAGKVGLEVKSFYSRLRIRTLRSCAIEIMLHCAGTLLVQAITAIEWCIVQTDEDIRTSPFPSFEALITLETVTIKDMK